MSKERAAIAALQGIIDAYQTLHDTVRTVVDVLDADGDGSRSAATRPADELKGVPDLIRDFCPRPGQVWIWEPNLPHARATLTVEAVEWNGKEVWITATDRAGRKSWNTLSRWMQAAVLVEAPE